MENGTENGEDVRPVLNLGNPWFDIKFVQQKSVTLNEEEPAR
jgi:hypothetical protein